MYQWSSSSGSVHGSCRLGFWGQQSAGQSKPLAHQANDHLTEKTLELKKTPGGSGSCCQAAGEVPEHAEYLS